MALVGHGRARRRRDAQLGVRQQLGEPAAGVAPAEAHHLHRQPEVRSPRRSTRFGVSATTTKRRAAEITIFSRRSAPPPPLIRLRSGVHLVGAVEGQVELERRRRARRSRCRRSRASSPCGRRPRRRARPIPRSPAPRPPSRRRAPSRARSSCRAPRAAAAAAAARARPGATGAELACPVLVQPPRTDRAAQPPAEGLLELARYSQSRPDPEVQDAAGIKASTVGSSVGAEERAARCPEPAALGRDQSLVPRERDVQLHRSSGQSRSTQPAGSGTRQGTALVGPSATAATWR